MIYKVNLRAMVTTMKKQENEKIDFGGGFNAGQSPPHPPSKKASIPDHSLEGFKKNSLRVAL